MNAFEERLMMNFAASYYVGRQSWLYFSNFASALSCLCTEIEPLSDEDAIQYWDCIRTGLRAQEAEGKR
jgi:hypothetical protein